MSPNPHHYISTLGEKNSLLAAKLEMVLPKLMDLTPRGIRESFRVSTKLSMLELQHMAILVRNPDLDGGFSWEKIDLVEKIKAAI